MEGSSAVKTGDRNTIYFCIKKDGSIVFSYSHNRSEEQELLAEADRCLENAPPHHRWCTHTINTRTFGCLMADGCFYFAIVDPTSGSKGIMQFLHDVREAYVREAHIRPLKKSSLKKFMAPAVQQLLLSLENVPRTSSVAIMAFHGEGSGELSMPLLLAAQNGAVDMGLDEIEPVDEHRGGGGQAALSVDRNPDGSSMLRATARRLWRRHAVIIVVGNVILVAVLLAIWLWLCRGVQCLNK